VSAWLELNLEAGMMLATQVIPGLWAVPLKYVNTFLLKMGDGLVVIDTGFPGCAPRIVDAIREIGHEPDDVCRIVVTHCHSDHAGSLAELKRLTGAPAAMHPVDAAMVRQGQAIRPLAPAPGILNSLVCRFLIPSAPTEIERVEIENEIVDGEALPVGLTAIHVPGHCAGQLAILWPEHGGVLFAADAAANVFGLALSPLYEDLAEGRRSLSKLSAFSFEIACFGHGKPIRSGASVQFRKKWPAVRRPSTRTART
jgi:glyoxylase-like metal-dependent hydrolase (beta-lactamase superfamily II)